MKKFWNKQCEMARTMMKSKITNDYIIQEYNKTSVDEWDKMCVQIDTLLRNHNAPINDSRWDRMIEDFSVVASGNNVDKTVLYVHIWNGFQRKRTNKTTRRNCDRRVVVPR